MLSKKLKSTTRLTLSGWILNFRRRFCRRQNTQIEYRTPKKKTSPDSAEQEKVVSPEQSGTLPPAATDEQLAEAASKGRQLLQQQTEAGDKKRWPFILNMSGLSRGERSIS